MYPCSVSYLRPEMEQAFSDSWERKLVSDLSFSNLSL